MSISISISVMASYRGQAKEGQICYNSEQKLGL